MRIRVAVITIATLAVVAYAAPPRVSADPVATTALVLKIVDGDTIDMRDDNRGRLRVRLLGIDTQETKKPNFTVGCCGPEATEFANSTMLGQRVALVTDPTKIEPTGMAAPWPTLSALTAGTIRSRPLAPARHTRTSMGAARSAVTTR